MVSAKTKINGENIGINRTYSYDVLRIFACFMVIVNHTNSPIFMNYFPQMSGQLSLVLFFISKTAVPIFFMLSGALLLGKQDTYRIAYGKRALRIFLDILIFSFVAFCVSNQGLNAFSFNTIQSMIGKPIITPYWYLYSYLAIMLMLPFLQKMVQAFKQKDFLILLGVLFFLKVCIPFLTCFELFPTISTFFTRNLFSGEIFYFILGYFITHYLLDWLQNNKRRRIAITVSIILFFAGIIFCWHRTGLEFYQNGKFFLRLDDAFNLPITIYSAAFFLSIILIFQHIQFPAVIVKPLCIVSQATFGVYLIHNIGISLTQPILQFLCANMNDWFAVIIIDIMIFICCTIVVAILRKIPLIKKLL